MRSGGSGREVPLHLQKGSVVAARGGPAGSVSAWTLCQGTKALMMQAVGFFLPEQMLLLDSGKGRGWGGSQGLMEAVGPSLCAPTPWTQVGGSKGRGCRGAGSSKGEEGVDRAPGDPGPSCRYHVAGQSGQGADHRI